MTNVTGGSDPSGPEQARTRSGSPRRLPRPFATFVVIAFAVLAFVAICAPRAEGLRQPQEPVLEVSFLDVGQGDAALVVTPDRQRLLVDAGPRGSGVAAYLRRRGIDTLDLVVASHNHADHVGGMAEVLNSIVVRNYMENGVPAATSTYEELVTALERSGARVLAAEPRTLSLGELLVDVLPGLPHIYTHHERTAALHVQFGEFRVLFTGDAELEQIRHWMSENRLQKVSVVKVPHHGSRTGAIPEFARITEPALAVFSLSARNQYGHPNFNVLSMWTAVARHVLRTDRDGTITVRGAPDGSMRVSTQRGNPPLAGMQLSAPTEARAAQ